MNTTRPIKSWLVLKKSKIQNMTKKIGRKISVKASASKHSGKYLPRDKTLEIETDICFYSLEDGDDIEEGE